MIPVLAFLLFQLVSTTALKGGVVERGEKKPEPCCNVKISPDQIPRIQEPLPVFQLCDQVVVCDDYLDTIIKNVAENSTLKTFGTKGASAAFDGDRLIAFVRPDTGESRVFPSFECLKPGTDLIQKAEAAAIEFAQNTALFPPDDTQLVPLSPVTLSGSKSINGSACPPEEFLAFVRLERQINGIPIEGPGTQAAIAVNADGCITAFAHRYRPAFITETKITPHCPEEIVKSIISDLSDTCQHVPVTIDNVVVRYYDSGNGTLQPVYSYQGSITGDNATSHGHVSGSISVGNASAPIKPVPAQNYPQNGAAGLSKRDGSPLTVGRYVVRADSLEWLNSATAFWDNLELSSTFGGTLTFTDKQYLAANPTMFTTQKNDFVNSVQIALNEVHGNWWEFSTYKNTGDIVTLQEIAAAGGLGVNASGSLAYWILHSCEVIPTQTDETTSFDVWWNLFRGLHSVVGYRTDMWIDVGVTTDFGFWVGLGAAIVPAWFLELATNNFYGVSDSIYLDTNRLIDEPMGRASSVSVCGHLDDTAHDVKGLGTPCCLFEMWLDN